MCKNCIFMLPDGECAKGFDDVSTICKYGIECTEFLPVVPAELADVVLEVEEVVTRKVFEARRRRRNAHNN